MPFVSRNIQNNSEKVRRDFWYKFGYEESPSPKTAYFVLLRESWGRPFVSRNLQNTFMLSGTSPWPVVDATKITNGSVGSLTYLLYVCFILDLFLFLFFNFVNFVNFLIFFFFYFVLFIIWNYLYFWLQFWILDNFILWQVIIYYLKDICLIILAQFNTLVLKCLLFRLSPVLYILFFILSSFRKGIPYHTRPIHIF